MHAYKISIHFRKNLGKKIMTFLWYGIRHYHNTKLFEEGIAKKFTFYLKCSIYNLVFISVEALLLHIQFYNHCRLSNFTSDHLKSFLHSEYF